MDETIFDEMKRYVLEIFIERNFKRYLVEFESIEWVLVWRQLLEAAWILDDLLNVDECPFQVVCSRKDDFVELFIIVAQAEVQVEHGQVRVFFELLREERHLFVLKRHNVACVFPLDQRFELWKTHIGLILFFTHWEFIFKRFLLRRVKEHWPTWVLVLVTHIWIDWYSF